MNLLEKLPNPFEGCDSAKNRLEQCEVAIGEMKKTISLLVESNTLLLSLCNRKNRANEKNKA